MKLILLTLLALLAFEIDCLSKEGKHLHQYKKFKSEGRKTRHHLRGKKGFEDFVLSKPRDPPVVQKKEEECVHRAPEVKAKPFNKFNQKHTEMMLKKYSTGAAAYFFDAVDPIFLSGFMREAQSDFQAFSSIPPDVSEDVFKDEERSSRDLSILNPEKGTFVNFPELNQGMSKFNWLSRVSSSARELILGYDLNNKYYLYFKEFIFMEIVELLKSDGSDGCSNCMSSTKTDIKKFFTMLDCDKDGYLGAEEMYKGLFKVKTAFPISTTMVNDIILKSTSSRFGLSNLEEFTKTILLGMFERVVGLKSFDDTALQTTKAARQRNIQNGFGPK